MNDNSRFDDYKNNETRQSVSLVHRPNINSTNVEISPEIQNFYEKFDNLTSAVQSENPDLQQIADAIMETNKAIQVIHSIPEEFIIQSQIIPFIFTTLSQFDDQLIFDRIAVLLFYTLNGSRVAILHFLQRSPREYIMRLFNSENQTVCRVGYLILSRLNFCPEGGRYCLNTELHIPIFQRTIQILDSIPPEGAITNLVKDQIKDLLNSIIRFPTFFDYNTNNDSMEYYIDISKKLLNHPNENLRSLSPQGIRLLFTLTKDPFYQTIYTEGLFSQAMNYISIPEATNFVLMLAIQMLYVTGNDKEKAADVMQQVPIDAALELFWNTSDNQLILNLLTLFTNTLQFSQKEIDELVKDEGIEKLYELINSTQSNIQQTTIWCIWNLLRFSQPQQMMKIIDNSELSDFLISISFDYDDLNFIKSVLIPSIMRISKCLTEQGALEQEPYLTFMESIKEPLLQLCYKEESPEIESIATSCLKVVFPDIYTSEKFI